MVRSSSSAGSTGDEWRYCIYHVCHACIPFGRREDADRILQVREKHAGFRYFRPGQDLHIEAGSPLWRISTRSTFTWYAAAGNRWVFTAQPGPPNVQMSGCLHGSRVTFPTFCTSASSREFQSARSPSLTITTIFWQGGDDPALRFKADPFRMLPSSLRTLILSSLFILLLALIGHLAKSPYFSWSLNLQSSSVRQSPATMAWRCTGRTNAELIGNLANAGLITSERVRNAMLGVSHTRFTAC